MNIKIKVFTNAIYGHTWIPRYRTIVAISTYITYQNRTLKPSDSIHTL